MARVGRPASYDIMKLAMIWQCLDRARTEEGWLCVAEIARRTTLKQSTVKEYLNRFLPQLTESASPAAGVRLRMVRLKPNCSFDGLVHFLDLKYKRVGDPRDKQEPKSEGKTLSAGSA